MDYDYKHMFDKKWKRLNKDLKKTIKKISSRKLGRNYSFKNRVLSFDFTSKTKISLKRFFNILNPGFSYLLFFVLSFFVVVFLISSVIFSNSSSGDNISVNSSFVSRIKIFQELKEYRNNYAIGGPESYAISKKEALKFYFYEIQKGDSVYSIAKKLGVSMDTIISLNKMVNAHFISEGNKILVPSLEGIIYTVEKGDTLAKIAQKYQISVEDIKDANELEEEELYEGRILFLPKAKLSEKERQKVLGYLFVKPMRGYYTSGFGLRMDPFTGEKGYHTGIDIAASYGAPVFAAKEGIVTYTGWNGGYGKCVIIKHQFGYETLYGHLSKINVKNGERVTAGKLIGRVGSTGRSTGPHLHFEVRRYDIPINPLRIPGLGKSRGRWY